MFRSTPVGWISAALWLVTLAAAAISAEPPSVERDDAAAERETLPTGVDLSPEFERLGLPHIAQGDRPTCSVCTVVGALEFAVAKHAAAANDPAANAGDGENAPVGRRLSVEFANWAKNESKQTRSDGGFFRDIWSGYRAFGIGEESAFPYRAAYDPALTPDDPTRRTALEIRNVPIRARWIKRWNPATGLSDAEFDAIRRTLRDGWPVCVGLRWPNRPNRAGGVLQYTPGMSVFDGHSVLFVGYHDGDGTEADGYFLIRNSQAPAETQKMSYAYARHLANDAISFPLAPR